MWLSASLLPRHYVLSKVTIASENTSAWLGLTPYRWHGCAHLCINGIDIPCWSFVTDRTRVSRGHQGHQISDLSPHHEVLDRLNRLHCRRSRAGRCLCTMRWPGMGRRDDMCVWIHLHVLQPVLLPVSPRQRGHDAVNFHRPAQLDLSVPAERDDLDGSLCDRLQIPGRG